MPRTFVDLVSDFSAGVNSGVQPLLLRKNQLAMAVNVSLRGGFAKTRAPYLQKTLNFGGDPVLQNLVLTGLFQGAQYYRPDSGPEQLIASISGHIIQFVENGQVWNVSDVSIPTDLNSPASVKVWMFQAEKWLIINDGSGSLPLFYDGTSCRRSDGPKQTLGSAIAFSPSSPPAIGGIVTVTLANPFSGRQNQTVIFNKQFYQVTTSAAGTYVVNLQNVNDVPGTNRTVGAAVTVNPQLFGYTTNVIVFGGLVSGVTTIVIPSSGVQGVKVNDTVVMPSTVGNLSFRVSNIIGNNIYGISLQDRGTGGSIAANTIIRDTSNLSPIFTVGTLQQAFAAPSSGSSVGAVLSNPFTGPAGQLVVIGNAFYLATAPPSGVGTTTLMLINLTDPGGGPYTNPTSVLSVPELPAGRMGAYGMGRVWLSLTDGISYLAGDIVGGAAGTPANNYRDSVLKTTEDSLLPSGGSFRLPGASDIIKAMLFPPILDASLGQGPLQIFTDTGGFSNQSPVARTLWTSLTQPLQTKNLFSSGPRSQESTISVASDTFYRSDEGICSFILARRDFGVGHWSNKPLISYELTRILSQDNTALLNFGSAVQFDNRYFCTVGPTQTTTGVYHPGLTSLNMDLISSIGETLPASWEGLFTGLNCLRIVSGRVNGTTRCFAFTSNQTTGNLELWELLTESAAQQQGITQDNNATPISWFFETAVLFNKDIKPLLDFIRLNNGEVSLSNIQGQVTVTVKYRPVFSPCWQTWFSFTVASNMAAGASPQYRYRLGLGTPDGAACDPVTNTPFREGLAFQFRVEITGSCTFEDLKVEAIEIPAPKFQPPICDDAPAVLSNAKALTCPQSPGDLAFYTLQGP